MINEITKHITDTNGATIHNWELFQGDSGYVVGCGNIDTITIKNKTHLWHLVSKHYIKNVGFWMNEGKLYIDRIQIINDVRRALTLAHANNELAIWDIANRTEIKTINR